MRFDLRYGDGSLRLEIPNRVEVDLHIPPTNVDGIDIEQAIIKSLEHPIDSETLSKRIAKANTFAIVVNGHQDLELNSILLFEVLELFDASTADPTDVSIMVSTKPHESPNRKVPPDMLAKDYGVTLHDPILEDSLYFVGETPTYCTPLFANKFLMDADVKIGIDTIRSDVFVGATGGRMAILPHGAGMKSISRNSKLKATHPVGPFNLDSSVCKDLEEASKLACLDFIVNAVPDYDDKLHGVFSGNPYSAWFEGSLLAKKLAETPFRHKADIAFVSAGGSHYDQTLYDAVDALYAGHEATEYGGVIVLVAECENGAGEEGFIRGVSECRSGDDVAVLAETSFEFGMEKSRFFWDILSSRKVIICSRMRESLITEKFHCSAVKDPQEGYELARSLIVSSPSIAVIPHGIRTLPVMRNE